MMRKLLIAATLPLALAACAQTATLETGTVPAASFNALQLPGRVFASPRQIIAHYLAPLNRTEADEQEMGRYSGGAGDQLMLFSVHGLEDDSVSGKQFRVVIIQTDIGLRVVSAGERYQCARDNSDTWTASPCP